MRHHRLAENRQIACHVKQGFILIPMLPEFFAVRKRFVIPAQDKKLNVSTMATMKRARYAHGMTTR